MLPGEAEPEMRAPGPPGLLGPGLGKGRWCFGTWETAKLALDTGLRPAWAREGGRPATPVLPQALGWGFSSVSHFTWAGVQGSGGLASHESPIPP